MTRSTERIDTKAPKASSSMDTAELTPFARLTTPFGSHIVKGHRMRSTAYRDEGLVKFLVRSCLVTGALITVASPAHADADADAQDLFVRGRELRANAKCGEAVPLFRKANDLAPTRLGSLRNIAECEEQLSHYASARRAWLELGRGLLVTKDATKYDGWSKDAQEAAARLKPMVAELRVDVVVVRRNGEGPAQPGDGTTLTMNGEAVPVALYGTVLEKDPGKYTIVAEAPNAAPVEQVVALTAGGSREVRMRVVLKGPAPAVSDPPPPAYTTRTSPRRTVGYVGVGVGVASLAAAGVTLALRQGALSDLETACPGYATGPCPTSVASIVSRGEAMSTLTTVFGVAGAAIAATGLVLVLASPDERVPLGATPAPRVAITPTPGGAELTWRFR